MRRRSTGSTFPTIRSEGGLLPADLLLRIAEGDRSVEGLTPDTYHLAEHEHVNEAANRAWIRLRSAWTAFQAAREKLPEGDQGTSPTRERWLLILFQELGYGRLPVARLGEIGGKAFPVSHLWEQTPIHLVGCGVDLDHRTAGVAGAARTPPHGLMQELLNRRDDFLWGFVSNGLHLRILRDSVSLIRQAYVEFDLEEMMEGEVFSDFVLLWLVCHQSRVEPAEPDKPETCWLERWTRAAQDQGTRALDDLRQGVEEAIRAFGRGFLAHAANTSLRDRLRSGALAPQDYYRQLLRLVYRLIFLFVAEERGLLLDPKAGPDVVDRYLRFYAASRLRRLAERRRGRRHGDLYEGLRLVMDQLGSETGCSDLALPALGSFLWAPEAIPDLARARITNHDLLDAVRALAFDVREDVLRPVDFRNLGAEELGSVYESLLELHPEVGTDAATFELRTAGGHERKTTGSYYTPTSLIQCLLDTALDPVLDEAARKPDAERAILSLKVCDPACGSGHFLIAAAHRIARRLAQVRSGDVEPSPEATRTALRDVVGHCLYGVDMNPMAVELCKVSLWLEALDPGKPLSFLEHRIQCGNSLLGTAPALMAKGIPDEAFEPIEGDDKRVVSALRRQNNAERTGQTAMFTELAAEKAPPYGGLANSVAILDAIDDVSMASVRRKEHAYAELAHSPAFTHAKFLADAWCAAFVWKKAKGALEPLTEDVFRRLREKPETVSANVRREVARLADQHNFFHWHLGFPQVFQVGTPDDVPDNPHISWSQGFDIVLGNPPWERIKLQEKEWFAGRHPEVASAANAATRRRLIEVLAVEDPPLYAAFLEDRRAAEGKSHLIRHTGRYPLCGRGDINTYAVFAETMRTLIAPTGRVGAIVPSGIATDDTTKFFFRELMESRSLVCLYSFYEIRQLFVDTDSRNSFCLLTLTGRDRPTLRGAEFAFDLRAVDELRDLRRKFALTAKDIELLNPNTRTCPVFRSQRDAELTKAIYLRVPIFIRECPPEQNPWGAQFMTMFHMSNDSALFRTQEQLEQGGWTLEGNIFRQGRESYLPLYEAKMIHRFDHRYGDYADYPPGSQTTSLPDVPVVRLQNPNYTVQPRYWVPEREVEDRLAGKWDRGWLIGWRDITIGTSERTFVATVLPRVGSGNKFPLLLIANSESQLGLVLLANLASFAFDYAARQKLGGTTFNFFIVQQLPVLPPETYAGTLEWDRGCAAIDWLLPRVLELTYTAWDLEPLAKDCGLQVTTVSLGR